MKALEKSSKACEELHTQLLFDECEWEAGLCKEAKTQACIAFNHLQTAQYAFQLAALAQQHAEDKGQCT